MVCYINLRALAHPSGFSKIIQLIISFVCIGLLRHYILSFGGNIQDDQSYYDRELFGKITIGGMILVTLPQLIAAIFDEGRSALTELLYCFIGILMFTITGALVLDVYVNSYSETETSKAGLALGSLCVVNAFFYSLDAFFAFQKWRKQ